MAQTTGNLTTSTTAAKFYGPAPEPTTIVIVNEDATNNVRVGGAQVSSTLGLLVPKGSNVTVYLKEGESLWVAAAAGTPAISWYANSSLGRGVY